jgi:hypothetical protein
MPLLGQGVLIIWHGITPEGDQDMIRWHNTEHVPERVGVPGFLRGRRYRDADHPLQYLDLYETETVETIQSAPYLARLNDPTPWTRRVLPHFRDTVRLGCRVAKTLGRGQGGTLVTGRLHPVSGGLDTLRAWLTGPALDLLREPNGAMGIHVLETVAETTRIGTAEGKLKGGEVAPAEEPWPLILLVECSDRETARTIVTGPLVPERLAAHGGGAGGVVRVHDLQVTMDRS